MAVSRYGKELAEMSKRWNCGEKEAAQQFIQAYYILKGNRPEAAADFINTWSDDVLFCAYVAVMDDSRRQKKDIDLLALEPVEP